ncbi:hypothetical protein [Streptomyces sp. A0592]|uniref:hypothetical protein n=1 Tax=Streptomyces sp. A0592 TaxID=2563099 RepID=UPI0019D007A4|nr:hypothetical protein [Streptomyces sp. A0592]
MHQLIQHATRDTLTPNQQYHAARTAADALMDTWPEIERDTDLARMFQANAHALTRHGEEALYSPDAHPVLYRLGVSLGDSGQVTRRHRPPPEPCHRVWQHPGRGPPRHPQRAEQPRSHARGGR